MLCAISGEAPQEPVASKKSGNVFEKRLIESYIAENGKDPVNGEELSTDDLVSLQSARVVKPRPPTLTSIPSLLSVFQNEWDAITLETFTLKQHLSQLRQELSTALYNNDAAIRVIARLTKERDEARDALAKVSVNDRRAAPVGGDSMQVDGHGLPDAVVEKVKKTYEALSKTRKKRPIPDGWASTKDVESIKSLSKPSKPALSAGARALAVDEVGEQAIIGGSKGNASIFSLENGEQILGLKAGNHTITDALFWEHDGKTRQIVATSAGTVNVYEDESAVCSFDSHSGTTTSIALHPCKEVLASVGEDKSLVMHDLSSRTTLSQVYTSTSLTKCQFHPDGHLIAAGGVDGKVKIFHVLPSEDARPGDIAVTFDLGAQVQDLCFSENGYWLAAVTKGSTSVGIWDLRKAADPEKAKIIDLDFGGIVDSIRWDLTGQYLVGAGASGVTVQQYEKSSKSWSEPLRRAANVASVRWGAEAKSLVILTTKGALEVMQ